MITETTVAQSMVAGIAEAICERPGDTAAQRAVRFRDVVHSVQAFQPRDPVEIMLAGVAVTHVHLIQDSARDSLRGQEDRHKARTKATIVALDRGMLGFLKELRMAQARTIEVSDSMPAAAPAVVPPEPTAEPARQSVRSRVAEPEPPMPLSPPLRRAETSVAAMMAVVSPPNARWLGHTGPVASGIESGMATSEHAGLPSGPEAAKFEAAVARFAAAAGKQRSGRPRAAVGR